SSKTDSTITGKILLPMHLNELENLLQALPGKTSKSDTSLNYSSREIEFQVEKSGDFSIHHQTTEKTISKFINQILALILKTENCANCGVCEDICPQNIIRIEKTGSQFIPVIVPSTESPCIHCLKCISHCPLHQKIKEN
ncbi:MAG: 4Fe-4S dicluster domain-containing protein, partial [Promethearchaeota archaeon]